MCPHSNIRIIAARSGEWWWCKDCGWIRDPEGRWHTPKNAPRVRLREPDTSKGTPSLATPRHPTLIPRPSKTPPEFEPPRARKA